MNESVDRFTSIPAALNGPHVAFEVRRGFPGNLGSADITNLWPLAGELKISSDGLLLQIINCKVVNHFKPSEVVIAPILGLDRLVATVPVSLQLRSPERA